MLKQEPKKEQRLKRKRRVRAKISGTAECPRVAIFRSLKNVSVQAIDDLAGKTLASAGLHEMGKKGKNTVEGAALVGKVLAERLSALKIDKAVFDRAGYRYHGKVKAVAEALRENGIKI